MLFWCLRCIKIGSLADFCSYQIIQLIMWTTWHDQSDEISLIYISPWYSLCAGFYLFIYLTFVACVKKTVENGSDRVGTIIIHNRTFRRGICCFAGFWCWRSTTELLHCIASLTLVVYLAPSTISDSFSTKPQKSDHIYGWLNRGYVWKGGNWKKLQQECPLEHPCAGENTINSPLLWQMMECPQGWSLSGENEMWGRMWAALHSGIFDGICALCRSLDVSRPLQFL